MSPRIDDSREPMVSMTIRADRLSLAAIAARAKAKKLTMKQVIFRALKADGVHIQERDLVNRNPRQRMK